MKKISQVFDAMDIANDALVEYREGIVTHLSLLGGSLLGAIGVLHLVTARWSLMALNVAVAALLLGNAWNLSKGRGPLVRFGAMAPLLILAVVVSTLLQGLPGVLWAFPMLFLSFFALSRRLAMVLSVVLIVSVTAASLHSLSVGVAFRIFVSLSFVLLMINVVLGVLGDLQRALVMQAITDPLTGCYNRRHLQTHLDQIVPSPAGTDEGAVLLAIDIDHFKSINDRHGHDVGDEVLCNLVQAIKARQRLGDLLFRTGGEEFALLLPRSTTGVARIVAESLREHVAGSELLHGEPVTISVGISAVWGDADVKGWLKSADTALYRAKREGRNRVVLAA